MVKVQSSKFKVGSFVIGVDGGGTKTAAALADMEGKIIARVVAGVSVHLGIKPRQCQWPKLVVCL